MGGRAEGLACADPGAKTPIGASGNLACKHNHNKYICLLTSISKKIFSVKKEMYLFILYNEAKLSLSNIFGGSG